MSSLINVGAAGANIVERSTELGKLIVVFQEHAPSPAKGTADIEQRYTLFARAINQRSLGCSEYRGFNSDRSTFTWDFYSSREKLFPPRCLLSVNIKTPWTLKTPKTLGVPCYAFYEYCHDKLHFRYCESESISEEHSVCERDNILSLSTYPFNVISVKSDPHTYIHYCCQWMWKIDKLFHVHYYSFGCRMLQNKICIQRFKIHF